MATLNDLEIDDALLSDIAELAESELFWSSRTHRNYVLNHLLDLGYAAKKAELEADKDQGQLNF